MYIVANVIVFAFTVHAITIINQVISDECYKKGGATIKK